MSNKSQNNREFYEDLDEARSHASCCTCQTMAIFFIGVLIILIGITIFLVWKFNKDKAYLKDLPQKITSEIISKKFNFNTMAPGEMEIWLGNDDLTRILANGISFDNFTFKEIQAFITPKGIILTGMSPIGVKFTVLAEPKVENGKIVLTVIEASSGKLKWPQFMAKSLSKNITNLLNQKIWLLYQTFEVKSVELQENKMVLRGEIK